MKDKPSYVQFLATLMVLLVFGYVWFASFVADPSEQAARTIDTVIGFMLGSLLAPIIGYFFGSSVGSKDKQAQIERQSERGE